MRTARALAPLDGAPDGGRLLVVDDDPDVRDSLGRALRCAGYAVTTAVHGADALDSLARRPVDLIVLDVLMPIVDGLDACRRLRARGDATPVLVLTARDGIDDRVLGLEAGADDYLVKPFHFAELLARVRALQRRGEAVQSRVIKVANLALDSVTREVSIGSARPRLTATELSLLEILLQRSPAIVSRRSIALAVWNEEADALGSNTLDVHLARLRAKIASSGAKIEAVRAIGYRIVPA